MSGLMSRQTRMIVAMQKRSAKRWAGHHAMCFDQDGRTADLQALHRMRSLFVKHRTAVINQIRGLLAEYGLVIAPSPEKVRPAVVRFLDDVESGLTACARDTFSELYEQLRELDARIERVTHRVERVYRTHPVCRKLAAVPGIGPLTATALLATIGRPQAFQNGRHLAT